MHFDSSFWSWFDSVRNRYAASGGSAAATVVNGRQNGNSTACSSRFLTNRAELSSDKDQAQVAQVPPPLPQSVTPPPAIAQHGLDHPPVAIDVPYLECRACGDDCYSFDEVLSRPHTRLS